MAWHGAIWDGRLNYQAIDDRQLISGLLDDVPGVLSGSPSNYAGLAVSSGSGMNSNVGQGRAAVLNNYATLQGGMWIVRNDATTVVTHNPNSSGNPRWDCVGVRVYDSETGGDSSDIVQSIIVQGTPSASASYTSGASRWNLLACNMTGAPGQSGGPSLPNNFLPLGMVLVPSGSSSSASFSYLDWRQFISGGRFSVGWIPLTLPSGIITYAGAGWISTGSAYTPSVRIDGDVVRLKGAIQNNSGGIWSKTTALLTLPSGSRPSSPAYIEPGGPGSGTTYEWTYVVATDGNFYTWTDTASFAVIPLDGITFTLN